MCKQSRPRHFYARSAVPFQFVFLPIPSPGDPYPVFPLKKKNIQIPLPICLCWEVSFNYKHMAQTGRDYKGSNSSIFCRSNKWKLCQNQGSISNKWPTTVCNLEGLQDSGDPVRLGQQEPFRTQMYTEYKVNAVTTASWTRQRLLGKDRVQL